MPTTFSIPTGRLDGAWVVSQHRSAFEALAIEKASDLPFSRLGDLVDVSSGQYVSGYVPGAEEGATPYLRVDNVRGYVLNLTPGDLAMVSGEASADVPERCLTQVGDVVISRTGTLGKAALAVPQTAGFVLSQHVSRLTPLPDGPVTAPYLALCLNAPLGRRTLIAAGAGSTRLELTHASLAEVRVPVAPPDVQREYGEGAERALRRYYDAVNALSKLRDEADGIVFRHTELLGEGADTPSGPRTYSVPSGTLGALWTPANHRPRLLGPLEDIQEAFECVEVGDVAHLVRGKGTRSDDYAEHGVPFLRTSSLINGSFDPLPDHYAAPETVRRYGQEVEDGDILFSIEGRIGMATLLVRECPVVYKNHIERVRVTQTPRGWDPQAFVGWTFLMLSGTLGKLQVEANTVVQSTISGLASRLRQFVVPAQSEQHADAMRSIGRQAYDAGAELARAAADIGAVQASFDDYLVSAGAASLD